MRLTTLALLAALASTASAAQDISIKMAEIPAGSWFLMQQGTRFAMHVFNGGDGATYTTQVVPSINPKAPPALIETRDGQGNVTERRLQDGRVTRFAPHNCQRVVGLCRYTKHATDRWQVATETAHLRENVPEGDGFAFTEWQLDGDVRRLERRGVIEALDPMGMLITGTLTQNGTTLRFIKQSASWDRVVPSE